MTMEASGNKLPLVSVVLICFNQSHFLKEALESVLHQNYPNWEAIVVNDGGTDNTAEVVSEYLLKDTRFMYVDKENGGPASARNYGISLSKGEYVLPLDADDKIAVDYLSLAVDAFTQNKDTDLVYCNAEFFGAKSGTWRLNDYSFRHLLVGNCIFSSCIFKKTRWSLIGGYDESFRDGYEDWDFNLSYLTPESTVVKLDYVGFYYRIHNHSRNNSFKEKEESLRQVRLKIFEKNVRHYWNEFGDLMLFISDSVNFRDDPPIFRLLVKRILSFFKRT